MKNKQNAKERRAQDASRKNAAVAEIAAKAKEDQRKLQEEEERQEEAKRRAAAKKVAETYLSENPPEKRGKKSGPKAAGVKSLFMLGEGEMLMTAFGRGNDAVQEKEVRGSIIENLQKTPAFSAETAKTGYGYVVSGRMTHGATLDDPNWSKKKRPGDDLIGLRRQLEQLYFGRTFEDNIHIQLIYSILDIEKILSMHINNIIYEINNLLRSDDDEFEDLFQSLSAEKTYEKFMNPETPNQENAKALFEKLMTTSCRAYFGEVIYREPRRDRDGKALPMEEPEKKRCYYLLALLATLRHSLAHGRTGVTSVIYQLDTKVKPEARQTLNALYAAKINAINKGFVEKASKKNLPLLFGALNVTDQKRKEQLARDYYDFNVRKEYKNQGFSIKTLREIILTLPDAAALKGQQYDSVRSKLYMLFDFIVFDWYRNHPDKADALVNNLRGALTEEEKVGYYCENATQVWADIKPAIMSIVPQLSGSRIKYIVSAEMDEGVLKGVLLNANVSSFSKLMYLVTCFQDGKEINDLLTTLINKFEGIASFLQLMEERKMPCTFLPQFRMFASSKRIAGELRTINAFARMAKPDMATKRAMFYDAARLLGFKEEKEKLEALIEGMLGKDGGTKLSDGKKDNSFRNFIINNVIESRRFQYLVRYGNPEKLCRLVRNKKVVAHVLKGIPDAQIVRYYNSCLNLKEPFSPKMRDKLQDLIAKVDFTNFELIRTNARYASAQDNIEKERQKAIVRLYLTVLHLLVKNLVLVNSRYFIAFHCVERDAVTYDSEKYANLANPKEKKRLRDYAMERVEAGALNRRATRYMKQNFANSDPMFITEFRNYVDHLNVVRNADSYIGDIARFDSYFELYHYLLQRSLIDKFNMAIANGWIKVEDANPKSLEYIRQIEVHHTYCKDMVKALNVPFAYSLPRYKNLSVNELFDRNYPPVKADKDDIKPE